MLKTRVCPECGNEIMFSYIVPERSYTIEDGEIVRGDAWVGPYYDNPHFDFYCSNDRAHDIEKISIIYERSLDEWQEEIENEFFKQNMLAS